MDTVLTAVLGANWRRLGEELLWSSQLDEIEQLYQSDDDRLHAVIQCWMQGDGVDKQPSWRRIICALDGADGTRIADKIRHFAEPVSGKSCDSIGVSIFL